MEEQPKVTKFEADRLISELEDFIIHSLEDISKKATLNSTDKIHINLTFGNAIFILRSILDEKYKRHKK